MLNIVVALATESRPIIDRFGLREEQGSTSFRVCSNARIKLIVSGIGRVNAAAATTCLGLANQTSLPDAWLNVGIAGHADLEIGTGCYGVKLREASTDRNWYPPQVILMPGKSTTVCTVDQPEVQYRYDYVYDMEASAYYATALRFSSGELIQTYKIISDNKENSIDLVDKKRARALVTECLDDIDGIAEQLLSLSDEITRANDYTKELEHFFARWPFTMTQKSQLKTLVRRWYALNRQEPLWRESINRCPSAKAVLFELSACVDDLSQSLPGLAVD